MRAITAAESNLLDSAAKRIAYRVEIKNAAGVWQDFTDLADRDWVVSIAGGDSIEDPIPTLDVTLRRDHAGLSLSPFRGDSSLNIGGAAIDVGRAIRCSVAYAEYNATPVDFYVVHEGTIDSLDFSGPEIPIKSRMAVGALLVDSWVREETKYGGEDGKRLDLVMIDILADWAPTVTLAVADIPAFVVTEYTQQIESVWDALRTLAGLIGWDVRFLWDNASESFRPTLIEPDRGNTIPDHTFGAQMLHSVDALAIDRTWIRNVIRVTYVDADDEVQFVEVQDSASIARFGEFWAEIVRGSDDPINTIAEATDLANAALSDMAWPIADQTVQLPYFWPAEAGDLYRFNANGIHYSSAQDLALTRHRWELRPNFARSWLSVRGKPAGFYQNWIEPAAVGPTPDIIPETEQLPGKGRLRLKGRRAITLRSLRIRKQVNDVWGEWTSITPAELPTPWFEVKLNMTKLSKIAYEAEYTDGSGASRVAGDEIVFGLMRQKDIGLAKFGAHLKTEDTVSIGGIPGVLVADVFVYDLMFEVGVDEIVPEITSDMVPTVVIDATDVDEDGFVLYVAERPARGFERYVFMIPVDADAEQGPTYHMRVDPSSTGEAPYFDRMKQTGITSTVDVFGRINDPEEDPAGGTLSVWTSGSDFSGDPSGVLVIGVEDMPYSFGPFSEFSGTPGGDLLNNLPAPRNETAQIALKFDTADGRTTGQVLVSLKLDLSDVINEYGELTVNSWLDALELATGADEVGVGEELPEDGEVYTRWYIPSEGVLYEWDGDSWEPMVGQFAQLFAGKVVIGELVAGAINAQGIAAGAIKTKLLEVDEKLSAENLIIGALSLISDNAGAIIQGALLVREDPEDPESPIIASFDMSATGSDPILWVQDAINISRTGSSFTGDGTFSGDLNAAGGTFEGDLVIKRDVGDVTWGNGITFVDDVDWGTTGEIIGYTPDADNAGIYISAGGARLVLLDDKTNPSTGRFAELVANTMGLFADSLTLSATDEILVDGTDIKGIGYGAADSGGAGYKLLRIPN